MNLFLRAKHWQLFLAAVGIPFILQLILMYNLVRHIVHDEHIFFNYLKFFPLIMLIAMGTLFSWFWSVAIGLQKAVPAGIIMKVAKFKLFFFIAVVYLLCFLILFLLLSDKFFMGGYVPGPMFMVIPIIILPLHLFSMFCIFYCLYFVAKTLKTVELQRPVSFSDFTGEFFLMWFYFVGVWILQPRINAIIDNYDANGMKKENIDKPN